MEEIKKRRSSIKLARLWQLKIIRMLRKASEDTYIQTLKERCATIQEE
jgi:hypothetical protein